MNNKINKKINKYHFWIESISVVWKVISRQRKLQFITLIGLNTFSAVADTLSLASLIPFLGFLLNPEKVTKVFPEFFQELTYSNQFLLICLLYFILVLIAGVVRMANLWINNKISFTLGSDIGRIIFYKTINSGYNNISRVSTNEFVDTLIKKNDALVSGGIIPIVQLLSSGLIVIFTVSLLLFVSPIVTLTLAVFIVSIYLIILILNNKKLKENSYFLSKKTSQLIQIIQEAIICSVEITIYKKQKFFTKKYHTIDLLLRELEAQNQFHMHSPKIGLEIIGILLIAVTAIYFHIQVGEITAYIPLLATFALAAQRLLPNLQQIYAAIINIRSRAAVLEIVINHLRPNPPQLTNIKNSKNLKSNWYQIKFENIEFKYEEQNFATLKKINLTINRGDRIGIYGTAGGGKTTLAKIIMGLEIPTFGHLYIDNEICSGLNFPDWYSQLAYVPQSIPLLNASIINNIAFGEAELEIDIESVKKAAEDVRFADDIQKLPNSYDTLVGEFGNKLSGGQKLKLGLARALYRKAKLLVLDEYTGALDKDTEGEIVNVIKNLSKDITILIISHRPEAMEFCEKFIRVDQGSIINLNEYKS